MKLQAAELSAADALVDHLCLQVDHFGQQGDPLRDRYVGFCAVTAATHLETVLKTVVLDFCRGQNRFLQSVFEDELKRFNGRISYQELRKLLRRFDKRFDDRFVRMVDRLNRITWVSTPQASDLLQAYESLLEIRHSFVHNINATFGQVTTSDLRGYMSAGKRVAAAFARSLGRTR
jgi:hypothetical protein